MGAHQPSELYTRLLALIDRYPYAENSDIATAVGCTRAYVWTVRHQFGKDVPRKLVKCGGCGVPLKAFVRPKSNYTKHLCPICCKKARKCPTPKVPFVCEVCKEIFYIKATYAKRQTPRFCGNRCQGRALGKSNIGKTRALYKVKVKYRYAYLTRA